MTEASTIAMKVRTGSADSNGMLLLVDGELVAIVVELTDKIHGQACGRWAIENTFGLFNISVPETFADIAQASDWMTRAASGKLWQVLENSMPTPSAKPDKC